MFSPGIKWLCRATLGLLLFSLVAASAFAAPTKLGDLNDDGVIDVFDLTRLREHLRKANPLPQNLTPFADLTGDGFLNEDDSVALINVIVGRDLAKSLPLASIREASPFAGESSVALTREVIVRFTMPLALEATLTTWDFNTQTPGNFYAEGGGRKLLTRVELSGDRLKATLFFLEPVPASTRVTVTFNGAGITDLLSRAIDPEGDGNTGGFFTYTYDTAPITPVIGTGIIGHVYASEKGPGGNDVPLPGVLVRVVGSETLFTHTAPDGSFNLNPCPAGRFFVEVDGRTSALSNFPDGGYYPYINKPWEALPGKADNLAAGAGLIYLPLVPANTLQPVSAVEETKIAFAPEVVAANPALAGVEIYVPPNSLFGDDGTRGGKVGLAPVASDRLPEPLPPGLNHALDISIQSDGATNFDRPVPVRFPNLPDPVTGIKLPPGAKSALWSYNHDKGAWEIAGPMTVTDDGNFVVTDVGVGVRQPGWHGSMPGRVLTPDPPVIPSDPEPTPSPSATPTYPDTEIVIRTFIPSPAVVVDFPTTQAFAGDGRSFASRQGTSRTHQDIVVNVSGSNPIHALNRFSSPTLEYKPEDTLGVAGKPSWYRLLKPDARSINDTEAEHDETNSRGDVYRYGETLIEAKFSIHIKNKLALPDVNRVVPALDYLMSIKLLGLPDGTVAYKLSGNHDGFPAYEVYLNGVPVYLYDPVAIGAGPFLLTPPMDKNVFRSGLISQAAKKPFSQQASFEPAKRPYIGSFFYALENISTGVVVQRGTSQTAQALRLIVGDDAERFKLRIFAPSINRFAEANFDFAPAGSDAHSGEILFGALSSADTDSDGLSDAAESIIGTNPKNIDTDLDGISDGAEVTGGSNPLDNLPTRTGILTISDTPGHSKDLTAQNSVALLADSSEGVSVFNVSNALNPIRTAQIRLGGSTESVALDGTMAAATGSSLSLLDLSDLSAVRVTKQLSLGATPRAVAAAGGVAYPGLDNGQVAAVDMATGVELERIQVSSGPIHDLSFAGDVLYARSSSGVHAIAFTPAGMAVAGSAPVSAGSSERPRLFAGGGVAYAPVDVGYAVLSLADPLHPVVMQTVVTQQRGWRELVPTGSGLGVAAMGVNPFGDADVHLYDLNPDGFGSEFLTTFVTPGVAEAISIFNGLAYVADGDAGLTVVNYKAYDALGVPPTISISTGFATAGGVLQAEEGKLGRVTAAVSDDVQVRNVELYVDGQLAVTDGNFPFEHRFMTPLLAQDKNSFTLRAKATDTGGNSTWSETLTVNLVADATPPRVVRFLPPNGALSGSLRIFSAVFSEPINPSTLTAETFNLIGAGPDGFFGTADDVLPAGGALTYRESSNSVFLAFAADISPGLYRLTVRAPLADLAGNTFAAPAQAQVRVFGFADRDSDGVPDDVEALLGLDPDNPDTDGDGIRDGSEDFDNDGLVNAGEIYIGTDPRNPDTNNNGIPDGQEDPDGDGLNNAREFLAGTDPNKADTDGDGWNDETEVTGGSSPTDARSRPLGLIASVPQVNVIRFGDLTSGIAANASFIAQPATFVIRNASDPNSPNGSLGSAAFVARPTLYTSRQFSEDAGPNGTNGSASVIATPLVYVARYDQPAGSGSWLHGTIQAQPPVTILLPSSDGNGPNGGPGGASFLATPGVTALRLEISGLFFAQPPVTIEIQNQ
jgi:hypothetical protein